MKVAVYWGCRILTSQYAYELSLREVLPRLGIEIVDLESSSCCGDPVRSINISAATYLAARNLALAEKSGANDLLVPCSRGHFNLCDAKHSMDRDEKLKARINSLTEGEELSYSGDIKIWHTIDLLHDVVKPETIEKAVTRPLKGLKLATHVGCQILRPSELGRIDDPETPNKLNTLVKTLGAEVEGYPDELECCGFILTLSQPDAAYTLSGRKLSAVQELGVDGLVDSCPACHSMFDTRQAEAAQAVGAKLDVPVVYYTQLLGIALGIEKEKLGLNLNRTQTDRLWEKIG